MAVTGERRQVNSTYYFVVEIANQRSAYFRSVSGLKSEAEVVPMQEGGMAVRVARLLNMSLEDLLAGRCLPGACPRCGYLPDFADESTVVEDAPRSTNGGGLRVVK